MFFREANFDYHGLDYVLVERGSSPFGQGFWRFELVERDEAETIIVRTVAAQWADPDWRLLHALDIEEHPYNMHPGELERRVQRRLRGIFSPDLYRRIDVPLVYKGRVEPKSPSPGAAAEAKPRSYVIVEVVSSTGAPMRGLRLELTAPGGSVHTVATDAGGLARLDGIDSGSCSIAVPGLDMSTWKAGSGAGTVTRTEPGRAHVVKAGECLALLANTNGIADWHKLWDHPDNANLKAKRKSPHVLLPGDSVFIPGIEVAQIERPTDATHRITVTVEAAEVELVLVFKDHEGKALEGEPYELTFEHEGKVEKKAGELSGSGELREKLPVSVRAAELLLTQLGESHVLSVGHLDPARDDESTSIESGAAARLGSLGFISRKVGAEPVADLRAAVMAFQHQVMGQDEPSGELDADTCDRLEQAYGV